MQIFLVVYIAFICRICILADEEAKLKEVILDIKNPNSSYINTFNRNPYGLDVKIHVANAGHRISSVAESEAPIWTSSNGYCCDHVAIVRCNEGNCCSSKYVARLMAVYTSDGNGARKPFYYEKDGSSWKAIEEEKFYDSFHIRGSKESKLQTIVLNLGGDNEHKKFYINNSPNFPFLAYTPNMGYRIKKVIYKTALGHRDNRIHVVWSRKSKDEHCIYASFYPKKEPKIGYLVIETKNGLQERFYAQTGTFGGWSAITKEDYLNRLKNEKFDASSFKNRITMDVRDVDSKDIYTEKYTSGDFNSYTRVPLPGFILEKVVDDTLTIWEGAKNGEKCIHANTNSVKGLCYTACLLIRGADNERKVSYFANKNGKWVSVDNLTYTSLIAERKDPAYTHKATGKIVMSSFKNRQDLRIVTYASKVDDSKGDIILVHGIRSYFAGEFLEYNMEWIYEHFGYPVSPDMDGIFLRDKMYTDDNATKYRFLFEYAYLDGGLAFKVFPHLQYEGSFVESLNMMGYNVYGLDLQSQGYSDSNTPARCHVKNFKDYIYDTLQFVSIVKRGKFEDSSQTWNEDLVYKNIPTDKKTFLLGFSMGGNIIVQAVQEFYKNAKEGARLIDGLMIVSGMFNIDCNLNTRAKRAASHFLFLGAWFIPKKQSPYENVTDYGKNFDIFTRYKDPLFYVHGTTHNLLREMFSACKYVKKPKNMVHYPKDLPTILIHSKDDHICDIKGPRRMVEKYFKDNENMKFIELDAGIHHLTVPKSLFLTKTHIREWLEKHTPSATNSNAVDKPTM
ncbi:hypothetical protein BEWA_022270 [Theileria equi strain WA]|uniref:Serine aminopeptidase S33 domain-containing protein n=1 Tax=Theileria equi strain WA TaxID=1537102 RepID=L0AWX1_THEEQ|nr:hypothetical protein BEWA_022270 [Theileria equi strain WA]AFZ79379.1 hypothetical protein BEWA_022270 [Theileria equi strain WA]|eukprot:XP_004829045.1 hypothetical protein BEWA_022270 [Theileria equi strain WA]